MGASLKGDFRVKFKFECYQSSSRHRKAGQGGRRDKPSMDKFQCGGRLSIKLEELGGGIWVEFNIIHAINHIQ